MADKYHIGKNGLHSRCKAKVRAGGGAVSECPGVDGSTGGHMTVASIASSGGGKIYRWDGVNVISKVDEKTGTYTVSREDGSRTRHYYADTGELLSWRDQRSGKQRRVINRQAANSGPSAEMVEINSKTPEMLRNWFKDFKRIHGVEITEYNKKDVEETWQRAHFAAKDNIQKSGNDAFDNSVYAALLKSSMLNLQVFKMDPEKAVDRAVDGMLYKMKWGKYKKVYKQGR